MAGTEVEFCWNLANFNTISISIIDGMDNEKKVLNTSPEFEYNSCWSYNFQFTGTFLIQTNKLLGENVSDLILYSTIIVSDYVDKSNNLKITMGNYEVLTDESQGQYIVSQSAEDDDDDADTCYYQTSTGLDFTKVLDNTPIVTSFSQVNEGFESIDGHEKITLILQTTSLAHIKDTSITINNEEESKSVDCHIDKNYSTSASNIKCYVYANEAENNLTVFQDYKVEVTISCQGLAISGQGVNLRFKIKPILSEILPNNFGSILGGQNLTVVGSSVAAVERSIDVAIRCGLNTAEQFDILTNVVNWNEIQFTTLDKLCHPAHLIYKNNEQFIVNLDFTQDDAYTAKINDLESYDGHTRLMKLSADNLKLSGHLGDENADNVKNKVRVNLRKTFNFKNNFDDISENHSARKRKRRDHPKFDNNLWTPNLRMNALLHISDSKVQKHNAWNYCKKLHKDARLPESNDPAIISSLHSFAESVRGNDKHFWYGIERTPGLRGIDEKFYTDKNKEVWQGTSWCNGQPDNFKWNAMGEEQPVRVNNEGCMEDVDAHQTSSFVLCVLDLQTEIDTETECAVESLTNNEIECVTQNNIPLGAYICECNYDDFGEMTNAEIDINSITYSIRSTNTFSKYGGAYLEIYAPAGTCKTCGTVIHLTSKSNAHQWWSYAEHSSDFEFRVMMPAMFGDFELRIFNKFGGMYSNVESIVFSEQAEVTGITLNSGDMSAMIGLESAVLAGNFPNCGNSNSNTKFSVERLVDDPEKSTYEIETKNRDYATQGVHIIKYEDSYMMSRQNRIELEQEWIDGFSNGAVILLCKENSQGETNGYDSCRNEWQQNVAGKFCHCIRVNIFDQGVSVATKNEDDKFVDHYTNRDIKRSEGNVRVAADWSSDNIYFWFSDTRSIKSDYTDKSTASYVFDRAAHDFLFSIREVVLTYKTKWHIPYNPDVFSVDVEMDCANNEVTMPSLPAGSYKFTYTDTTGMSNTLSDTFTYKLSGDSVSVLNSVNDSYGRISLGGGAEIQICGQGLGENSAVNFCGKTCTIQEIRINDSEDCVSCSAPMMDDPNQDIVCDLEVRDQLTNESFIMLNALEYSVSLTPIYNSINVQQGGSLGGTTLELSGNNLADSNNINDVEVSILSSPCIVKSANSNKIVCVTEKYPRDVSGYKAVPNIKIRGKGFAHYDHDDIENLTFEYIDKWSSSYTWGCIDGSCLPKEGEIIVIPEGYRVVLDIDTPLLKALLVDGGTLIVKSDQEKVTLNAEYIIVNNNGHLEIGTEEEPYPCDKKAEIVLYGHHRSVKLPLFGAKVLAIRTGTLDLHGCRKEHTWTLLENTAEVGDDKITLKVEPGWTVGDKILIATTGGTKSQNETEEHVIKAIDGAVITLEESLKFRKVAEDTYFKSAFGENRLFQQRAEVALLNRNIIIRGSTHAEWEDVIPACQTGAAIGLSATQTCFQGQFGEEVGSDEFGATIMLHKPTHGRIEFVEITHAGQAFALGRYSLHFHLSGNQPNSYVRGNSFHHTFNRALTIHATNRLLVEYNVAYNIMGLTYFIEDGIEVDNIIQYNLGGRSFIASTFLATTRVRPASNWESLPPIIV